MRALRLHSIRHGNLGITGGRLFCAKHFDTVADGEAMLWFEDDMLLQPPQAGLCRNGLRAHVPRLAEVARAIVRREGLDFVKLSFSEFFGDHHLNWAWYNVAGDVRERNFPDGTFRTRIDHSGVEAGVSYLVGEVHYSNWPMLMTRRGNAKLFLEDGPHMAHEAIYMARCLELERRGALRAGVLLASPVEHCRRYYYPAEPARVLKLHHLDDPVDDDASLSNVSAMPSRRPYESSNAGTRRARSATAWNPCSGAPCAETREPMSRRPDSAFESGCRVVVARAS